MEPMTSPPSGTVTRQHTTMVSLPQRLHEYELVEHSAVIRRLRIFVLRLRAEEVIFAIDEISVVPP